ncbi:MAG: hypothetical protein ACKVQU_06175 [Burkholderiales bacterium]
MTRIKRYHDGGKSIRATARLGYSAAAIPELAIVLFATLLHFVWEMLQAPFWVGMAAMPHWQGIRTCAIATVGDVMIALVAFWAGAIVVRSRAWLLSPNRSAVIAYIVTGLVITIAYEYLATELLGRWAYTDSQPRLPWIGTGIAPILQWLTLPFVTLWLARVHCWGRTALAGALTGSSGPDNRIGPRG